MPTGAVVAIVLVLATLFVYVLKSPLEQGVLPF